MKFVIHFGIVLCFHWILFWDWQPKQIPYHFQNRQTCTNKHVTYWINTSLIFALLGNGHPHPSTLSQQGSVMPPWPLLPWSKVHRSMSNLFAEKWGDRDVGIKLDIHGTTMVICRQICQKTSCLSSRQLWRPRKDLELDHHRNCRIRLNSYEMMNDFTWNGLEWHTYDLSN